MKVDDILLVEIGGTSRYLSYSGRGVSGDTRGKNNIEVGRKVRDRTKITLVRDQKQYRSSGFTPK